jgi:hypothetical protein
MQHSCQNCPFITKYKSALTRHQIGVHGEKFKCILENCNFQTTQSAVLVQHNKRVHLKSYDLQCQTCKYVCSTVEALRKHLQLHIKRTNYFCKQCPRFVTTFKRNLHRHIKVFHPQESFETIGYETQTQTQTQTQSEPRVFPSCTLSDNSTQTDPCTINVPEAEIPVVTTDEFPCTINVPGDDIPVATVSDELSRNQQVSDPLDLSVSSTPKVLSKSLDTDVFTLPLNLSLTSTPMSVRTNFSFSSTTDKYPDFLTTPISHSYRLPPDPSIDNYQAPSPNANNIESEFQPFL